MHTSAQKTAGRKSPDELDGLYAQVRRLARPGAVGEAQFGSAGLTFAAAQPTVIGLFQLTEPLVWPEAGNPAASDVPTTANARLLWLNVPQNRYGGLLYGRPHLLYFPTTARDGSGIAVGMPPLVPGDRCHAWFNRQSGRWELLAAATRWCRFEMTAALLCGQSAPATAYCYTWGGERIAGQPPAQQIIVHDEHARFSKMQTAAGDPGAMGIAQFAADRGRWEILSMETPGDFWGILLGDLHQWLACQTVRLAPNGIWSGYNVFGPKHGNEILVFNPPGGGNHALYWWQAAAGDRVLCRWDIRRGKYWFVAVEPSNLSYQPLDVVTGVSLSIDFENKTFQHRYTTRRVELPPWTTIGPPVQQ
jgi:hypothetical protein